MQGDLISYPTLKDEQHTIPLSLKGLRGNVISSITTSSEKTSNVLLHQTEVCLEYASAIINHIPDDPNLIPSLSSELSITILNCSMFYSEMAIALLKRAYSSNDSKSKLWSIAGEQVKKGLGLLQFLNMYLLNNSISTEFTSIINDRIEEYQILYQMSIIVLSFLKLKQVISNPETTKLDLQTNDMASTASLCLFNAKLCMGCYNNAHGLKTSSLVNKQLLSYLEGSIFLLLSIDNFNKNETGISIGMLEEAINDFSNIVPREQITKTSLDKNSSPKLSKTGLLKRKDLLKNKLQHNILTTKNGVQKMQHGNNKFQLIPTLLDVLNDFLIPLVVLLRYVYQRTNDKLSFKPIERNIELLKSTFPIGKSPKMDGIIWIFENNKLTTNSENIYKESQNYF
ncbi:similar to Saccharomyces cerevisiae YGR122W Probable ortholog of A. nidulans PalC, which is involved in pH regulation and binds to the ESCRT-III complex [Maudiozyma saulgeensis]|uniref:Similar to Saccharomyces cerevisiae YGR122W Probable ortholog of A. nidulans PalC, which is involved in pH regulation and binds to the ESCRT-III complex n=1 Tax=Maudiozyma saulgeensis TaxID=1789683 RepID=A0A1X7QXE9_9SACH|nr:similar to Saccharomyces cerevisiae YGR122W Probable ortholog of A. nidulans PalC, which is involved in pH regulation and binds to the ESCRT-III complex [Kazachstania saulgeensis]